MAVVARQPLLAGAFGAVAIAFSGVFIRFADVAPATSAVFRCAYAVPALAWLAARERRRHGRRAPRRRALSLLAGVAFTVDLVAWHASIGLVGAGLATVLVNVQVVFVGLTAWLVLGERPRGTTIAAVPVMLAGVTLISGLADARAYGADPVAGALLALLAAAGYAAFLLLLRGGNADAVHRADSLFDATLVAAVGALVAGVALILAGLVVATARRRRSPTPAPR